MRIDLFFCCVCPSMLLAGVCAAQPSPPMIQAVGDLPGGADRSDAWDISADGTTIVGASDSDCATDQATLCEAYRWSASQGMIGLGDLPDGPMHSQALAISADGSAIVGVGNVHDLWYGPFEAFRSANGQLEGLGLPGGASASSAYDVSGDGSVVVVNAWVGREIHGYRWTGADGYVDLGDLPGGTWDTRAFAISRDGSVIVGSAESGSGTRAFRWTSEKGMEMLEPDSWSVAYAISPDGQFIVGMVGTESGPQLFRWTEQTGMVAVGGDDGPSALALRPFAVSVDGNLIVGMDYDEAFIWDVHHGVRDLKAVMLVRGNAEAWNWTLERAHAIADDNRTIVGMGNVYTASGEWLLQGWIARLNRPGDVQGDGVVDIDDLLAVIFGWGPCRPGVYGCPADVAPLPLGDGAVNVEDLLLIITEWNL